VTDSKFLQSSCKLSTKISFNLEFKVSKSLERNQCQFFYKIRKKVNKTIDRIKVLISWKETIVTEDL